jgi:uncharacterized membrane protein
VELRRIAWTCHALLCAAVAFAILAPALSPLGAALVAIVLAPLLLVLPGLVRGDRRIEQRLAVLLVPYIGGISMEVVARAGASFALNVALLAAVLELGLLLALIRRPRSPSARE